jgi:ABC-type transport system involved in multi-copper enzyme maturation permease subunit
VLTLIQRTVARVTLLTLVLVGLLAAFDAALVAIAASLHEGGGFERLAGLAPTFIQQGLGGALTSFAGMAAFGFFEPLIVMLVVQFAVFVATEPAGDVESGLVDLVLARPIPRRLLVTRSLLVMTGAAIALPLIMGLSLWVSLWFLAPPTASWPQPRVLGLLMVNLAAVAWCFGAAGLAAAAFSRRRGSAIALVSVGAVWLYLMEVVGEAWPRMSWAAWVSPFHRFHGAGILAGQTQPARDLTILLGAGLLGVVLAYWRFNRRDL